MSESERPGPKDLVIRAGERGVLSHTSVVALRRPEIISQVERALADSWVLTSPGETLLVTMMPDDSGSMQGTKQINVIEGHNDLIEAMLSSPAAGRVMLQTRYLNGEVLNPFRPLDYCKDLTLTNYTCGLGTPLYEQTLVLLGAVMSKAEELGASGAPHVRTATLIMTDGGSTDPNGAALLSEVRSVVQDMRRVGDHIVAGMGFSASSNDQSFRSVFLGMGIDPNYIFTASSREEILDKFRMFTTKALELTSDSGESTRGS